jgi:hypothetical protein
MCQALCSGPGAVTTFCTKSFKGTPSGRARRPASAGLSAMRGITGKERGDKREARRRGWGEGHCPLGGGSLPRCL